MQIKSAEFVVSNSDYKKCPLDTKKEFAFIGRSNVGKSSLINMLCSKKDLAKISSKPGKTQLINHFLINNDWYLVDLPGYGYATVSKSAREEFSKIINNYLTNRPNLYEVFVLIDSRLKPQKIDLDFIDFLGTNCIPFVIVFTKIDKLSKSQITLNIDSFKQKMYASWEELPKMFPSSALTKEGKDEILNEIERYTSSN